MTSLRSSTPGIRASAAVLVVAAATLLSGCGLLPSPTPTPTASPAPSASAPAPTQPAGDGQQAAQCAQLVAEVQDIAADVTMLSTLVGTDPFAAFALVGEVTGRVGELQARVTDPELLQRIEQIQALWQAVVDDAQAAITSGDTGGIERAMTGMTQLGDEVTALQQFCVGAA